MSNRRNERAGWVNNGSAKIPCRWCGKMPEGRRLTFCSDACIHEHKLRTNASYAASLLLKRDHGVCQICGLDCIAFAAERIRRRRQEGAARHQRCAYQADVNLRDRDRAQYPEWHAWCDAAGLSAKRRFSFARLWEMDHVLEVVNGGIDLGLENLQTLCWRCHAAKTAELNRQRRLARAAEEEL